MAFKKTPIKSCPACGSTHLYAKYRSPLSPVYCNDCKWEESENLNSMDDGYYFEEYSPVLGLRHFRTEDKYNVLEKKLSEKFNDEMKSRLTFWDEVIYGWETSDRLSSEQLVILATFNQWLGTACGQAYLQEVGLNDREN